MSTHGLRHLVTLLGFLVVAFLLCAAYVHAEPCQLWRGQVYQVENGVFTEFENQALYTYDLAAGDGTQEQFAYGPFFDSSVVTITQPLWTGAVWWFGIDDLYPFDCQFTLAYDVDVIFHDEFEG